MQALHCWCVWADEQGAPHTAFLPTYSVLHPLLHTPLTDELLIIPLLGQLHMLNSLFSLHLPSFPSIFEQREKQE